MEIVGSGTVGTAVIGRDRNRMVVRWKGARYFGQQLQQHPELLNEIVLIGADPADVRQIWAFLVRDGRPIGVLHVEPRWTTPKLLTARLSAVKRMRKSTHFSSMASDIPRTLEHEIEARQGKGQGPDGGSDGEA